VTTAAVAAVADEHAYAVVYTVNVVVIAAVPLTGRLAML
jgi:hypothetical protein